MRGEAHEDEKKYGRGHAGLNGETNEDKFDVASTLRISLGSRKTKCEVLIQDTDRAEPEVFELPVVRYWYGLNVPENSSASEKGSITSRR